MYRAFLSKDGDIFVISSCSLWRDESKNRFRPRYPGDKTNHGPVYVAIIYFAVNNNKVEFFIPILELVTVTFY